MERFSSREINILLVCLILFGKLIILSLPENPCENIELVDHPRKKLYQRLFMTQYINYIPISIDGNDHFESQAGAKGWTGAGTSTNPYIIRNLMINGDYFDYFYLIAIQNVDLYFIIADCMLLNSFQSGIHFNNVSHGRIENNTIHHNHHNGIFLEDSYNNTLVNNTLYNNEWDGIYLEDSFNNTLRNNTLNSNTFYGIHLNFSPNNTLTNNTFVADGLCIYGYTVEECLQGPIADNTVNSRPLIFRQSVFEEIIPMGAGQVVLVNVSASIVHGQQIFNTSHGILTEFSHFLTFYNNTLINNHRPGIALSHSNSNTLINNSLNNNLHGIYLGFANNNTITNNSLRNNIDSGISLGGSSENNIITTNNFFGNSPERDSQAFDWSSYGRNSFRNNYFNDWTSPDNDGDGVVDVPYNIPGLESNEDPYPIITPYTFMNHFVTIPIGYGNFPNGGETLSGIIQIQWAKVLDSSGHPITYTVSYSTNSGTTWDILATGLSVTSYDWDTTTLADGANYLIQVNASCIEGTWSVFRSVNIFTIDNHHHIQLFTLHSPNGGEVYTGPIFIYWTGGKDVFNHVVTYTVSYSADSGSSWVELATGLSFTSYVWDSTMVADGNQYLIRINASCSEGSWYAVTSDSAFSIDNVESSRSSSTFPLIPSPHSEIAFDLLPLIPVIGLSSILLFVVTLVIIIRRQQIQ
ncbi:MAG: NosD domain-containing protein [Candidatus Hodarchaeota archaeon]